MAIELPASPKVYTTTYQNFRGVDYTNDATNIWYRRSPSGVNMISDEAGRPFKRTGWAEMVAREDFALAYGGELPDDFEITMCYYFTLAGDFYIIVFTTIAVFEYVNNVLNKLSSDENHEYEQVLIDSYRRGFFFEGDGTAAFYIYGSPRIVWKYGYDNGTASFSLVEPTIPTVIIGATPDGTGTIYENFNLLGSLSYIQYQTNNDNGTYKVILPNNVEQTALNYDIADYSTENNDVRVWAGTTVPFDTELNVYRTEDAPSPLTADDCVLHTDTTTEPIEDRKAWIEFGAEFPTTQDGEDYIKVMFPSTTVVFTDHSITDSASASLDTD